MRPAAAQPSRDAWSPAARHAAVADCLFLAAVVGLSVLLYVHRLGFYSDDWSFLVYLVLSEDQSIGALYRSIQSPHTAMRPVQLLYLAGLYRIFGTEPLGFHIVNAIVMASSPVLLYLVLRHLGQQRLLALAVPLIFALLPHYSTDRFWYAAFQANLSVLLYLLSLLADLRALEAHGARLWGWKALSVLAILGSVLAYEVVLPLFFLNIGLLWYLERRAARPGRRGARALLRTGTLLGVNLLAILAASAYKALLTTRTADVELWWRMTWFAELLLRATKVSFWDYGIAMPRVLWTIVTEHFHLPTWGLGSAVGMLVFAYLFRMRRAASAELPGRRALGAYVVAGIMVFYGGYAIFLTSFHVFITPTGIANRVAIASALGVAGAMAGAAGWAASIPAAAARRWGVFSALVALACFSGFVVNNTLARFWIAAYEAERAVLSNIFEQFPTLPRGSTLIVDGLCPYVGPAVVFESHWDLAGALAMHYRDVSIKANVVTRRLRVREEGLTTSIYGGERQYPYGEQLYVYDLRSRQAHRLTDAAAARHYFEAVNPTLGSDCPPGSAGYGVRVF